MNRLFAIGLLLAAASYSVAQQPQRPSDWPAGVPYLPGQHYYHVPAIPQGHGMTLALPYGTVQRYATDSHLAPLYDRYYPKPTPAVTESRSYSLSAMPSEGYGNPNVDNYYKALRQKTKWPPPGVSAATGTCIGGQGGAATGGTMITVPADYFPLTIVVGPPSSTGSGPTGPTPVVPAPTPAPNPTNPPAPGPGTNPGPTPAAPAVVPPPVAAPPSAAIPSSGPSASGAPPVRFIPKHAPYYPPK